jgi:hypothetical protein
VAATVSAIATASASSSARPRARSSRIRASSMIDGLIPLPTMIAPRNAVFVLR